MKYVIRFQKTGVICYTSHLDILKVFKRSFKRAGIRLAYSQGFNPHPKMGFAQPLSLGYESLDEYIEFEIVDVAEDGTNVRTDPQWILEQLRELMPEGLTLVSIQEATHPKTLAAITEAAGYSIQIPLTGSGLGSLPDNAGEIWHEYMDREEIIAFKKQKKKKEPVPVNIRPKIREITFYLAEGMLRIETCLDAGSDSNLSPELIISTFLERFGLDLPRSDIQVTRTKIHFKEILT